MTDFNNLNRSTLAHMLNETSLSDEEITTIHRQAWANMGLLIVRPSDPRLTPSEAAFIRDIAERLHEEVRP